MKKLALLFPLALFATNGDNLIGAGAKSRALAGSNIASYLGSESIFLNPATLTEAKKSRIEGGITLFMPKVHAKNSNYLGSWSKSKADREFIPYLGYVHPLGNDQAVGLGLFSVSGMGVDYNDPTLSNMYTALKYAKLSLAYAKSWEDLSFALAVQAAYGSLKIDTAWATTKGKSAKDLSLGYQLGLTYHRGDFKGALIYTSKIAMKYKGVYDFDGDGVADALALTQPKEIAAGLSYTIDNIELSAQIKRIYWHDAKGYREFEWKNQNVYALGATLFLKDITLRAGYNYNTKALRSFSNPQTAFFNIVGFPAISKRHLAFGFSVKLTPKSELSLAYLYAPKEHIAHSGFEATNEQHSITLGANYVF